MGLAAGNRVAIKIKNSEITSSAQLPSGIVVKTTNKSAASGYNEYDKSAFEADGTLIHVQNVKASDPIFEIKITWVAGIETTYRFNIANATLETA